MFLRPLLRQVAQVSSRSLATRNPLPPLIPVPKPPASATAHSCPVCSRRFQTIYSLDKHLVFDHMDKIQHALKKDPVSIYTKLFGPNYKSLSETQLRYSDGLVVDLQGPHRGHWFSFTRDEGGGPIKAIKEVKGYNVFQAVNYALVHIKNEGTDVTEEPEKEECNREEEAEKRNLDRKLGAMSMWRGSEPLAGTVGELYLINRGIPKKVVDRLAFRFIPRGQSYEDRDETKVTPYATLVVPVVNHELSLTGVQRIYVDPDGRRPKKMDMHKFSKGIIKNAAGIVQQGPPGSPVYLCEGPETGASLAAAVGKDATILASLSLGNLGKMAKLIHAQKPSEVVLAADGDIKHHAQKMLGRQLLSLRDGLGECGIPEFSVVVPVKLKDSVEEEAVDWNDVLIEHGVAEIQKQLKENREVVSSVVNAVPYMMDKEPALP